MEYIRELFYKGSIGMVLEKGVSQAAGYALIVAAILLCIAVPYLLGSLNFAIIISKKHYKDDVREHGSNNGGATNMLRTYGKKAAALTFLGDALKTVVSVLFGYLIFGEIGASIAGLFCMLGHIFPIYYRFKGGKGVVTLAFMVLMISPWTFLILFVIYFLILLSTKFVSLSSIMCALIYPLVLNRVAGPGFNNIIALVVAAIVVFMHRSNIKRLLAGTESKISLGKKK